MIPNLPEEVKNAVAKALRESRWLVPAPAVELILTAALPFLSVQGAVKKLEWRDVDAVCAWCYAQTPIGEYRVTWSFNESGQKLRYPDGTTKQFDGAGYGDRDAAKAAAQADYEARIRSAIETVIPVSQPSAARELALEEAAKIAFDISENGEYHGETSVDSTSSIYQQGAFEVYEAIRALSSPDHNADAGKVEGDGWKPIESAPKDGTWVLAFYRKECVPAVVFYDEHASKWCGQDIGENSFTHWRRLPTPPSSEVA